MGVALIRIRDGDKVSPAKQRRAGFYPVYEEQLPPRHIFS